MKIATAKISQNGIKVNKTKLENKFKEVVNKYARCNLYLYNEYVLDSPFQVDWCMLKTYIIENYPEIFKKLCNFDGSISYTSKKLSFYNDGSDKVLNAIVELCKTKEELDDLNNIFAKLKFKKKSDTVTTYMPSLYISSYIKDKSKIALNNPISLLSCMDGDFEIVEVSSSDVVMRYLSNKLHGIENNSGSYFFSDKDKDYDKKYLREVLKGDILGDTELSKLILKELEDLILENPNNIDYIETVFNACLDEMIEHQKSVRELHPEYIPCYAKDFSVYYMYYVDHKEKVCEITPESFGVCCIDWAKQCELSYINELYGFSGEFISEADVERLNLKTRGIPFTLYVNDTTVDRYYPIVNVYDKNGENITALVGRLFRLTPNEVSAENCSDNLSKYIKMHNNFEELDKLSPCYAESGTVLSIIKEIKERNIF